MNKLKDKQKELLQFEYMAENPNVRIKTKVTAK